LEPSTFGTINFDLAFLSSLFSIIIINLILSGDNAVVIAMAVRVLPEKLRITGTLVGSAGAVLFRIIFTFLVAQLFVISYLKLIGGVTIIWIAIKLFIDDDVVKESDKQIATFWHAIKIILIADITMSFDNMLAIAVLAHDSLFLLAFGLGLSIPLVIFTSNLLSVLIEKFPILIYICAALLGKIGSELIITDPIVNRILQPYNTLIYTTEAFFAVGIIIIGKLILKRRVLKMG